MSQFPGDEGSKFLAGTLGGPGYGEFPLGSAGPRIDPRDPRYIPPPQPGSGTNLDGLESLLRMPNPGFDGDMIPHPQPPRMDVGEPVRPPPLRQVKPFNNEVKLMPGEFEGPVKEGPGFTMPAKQRPGTVQRGGQGLFNPGQQLSSAVAPPPTTTTQFQAPNSMPQRQPPRLNNGGPIAYRRRFS